MHSVLKEIGPQNGGKFWTDEKKVPDSSNWLYL